MISVALARPESAVAPDVWFTRPRLLLLLAVFVVMAFPTVVIGTNSFFYRDMGQFGYPLALFHREAFWRGEIPLWNPLNNCGLPFLAQWNTLVLYPGSLIYLLLPLPWSMNLFVLAHLFLAAAGMYSLALRWTGNRFAASVAGFAFAWNGLTLHSLMWPNNIAALAWMPWVVLALERAWSEGGRRIVIGALVGAMQMLTGAPEIILLTWIMIGLLWLREFLCAAGGPASGSADKEAGHARRWMKDRRPRLRTRLFLRFAICAGLILVLGAAQLLPFIDLLRHSNRDASYGGAFWAMPPWGWANFLVPLFGCTPSMVGIYSQDSQQWTSSYYMGIVTVAFALMAFRTHESRVKWLTAFVLAGLVLSLGDSAYVLTALKKLVPLFGFIRFPIKYVVLVVFALPLLAAFGVKAFLDNTDRKGARAWFVPLFIGLFVVTATIAIMAAIRPVPGTVPRVIYESAAMRAAFLLGALVVLSMLRFSHFLKPRLAFAVVLLLMGADVLWHMPAQNPVVPNKAYGPVTFKMTRVPRPGEARAMISPPMQQALTGLAHPDPLTMFTWHRRMLLSDCNLLDNVPKVNGFFSLYLREANEVTGRLYRSTNYDVPLLDFLGVSQISDPAELLAWHERTNAMPLLTAGQTPVFVSPAETLDLIFAPDFNPRGIVYLPAELRVAASGARSKSGRVGPTVSTREKIEATVEAFAPTLVVVSQAYSPRWKAFLDGQSVPVWKANHAFQAVLVPTGQHRLELRYQDNFFRLGSVVSVLALLTCLALLWWLRKPALGVSQFPGE